MHKCKKTTMAVLLGTVILLGCSGGVIGEAEPTGPKSGRPSDHTFEIEVAGLKRQYIVHVPASYDATTPVPIVIMFHGGGGTARAAMVETGWTAKADQNGFLAVFPEGSRPDPSRPPSFAANPQTWNDGSNRPTVGAVRRKIDDVRFVSTLIDDLITRFNVDERRIYATGFSNGASMTFRVGRELSGRFAAIAPIAGSDWLEERPIGQPISLLYMTGTADPLNPIEGGEITIGSTPFGRKPPVREMIQKWVTMLGCPLEPKVVHDKDGVKGVAYGPCREGSEVIFYTIEGMGHTWPGGISLLPETIVGKTSDKIKATDVIWEFFQNHPKE